MAFEDVDNSGDWSDFCYCPRYKKENNKWMYWRHSLPTGVIYARADDNGKGGMNSQEFHYEGWSGGAIKGLFKEHATSK